MPGERLRAVVREALDDGVYENGYTDLLTMEIDQLCMDLLDYCADLEGATIEDIKPSVEEWLADDKARSNKV